MVTSYYIMKLTKNKYSVNTDNYFCDNIHKSENFTEIFNKNYPKCRICLREGSLFIYNIENKIEITDALKVFANIEINKDDLYPKHLCNICYEFIRNAIRFRKLASETDHLLRRHWKKEESKLPKRDYNTPPDSTKIISSIKKITENTVDSKIQCSTCSKLIKKSYYKIHMTMHDPNHEKYICDICGKTFRLRVGYYNHRLRHRTDYIYKCKLCPFKGRYSERLKSHMRTHSGDYKYKCTECPARFLFKGNFNNHVLLKHKEPQYKCENCKKAFHTKLKLQRHHEVDHLGIKSHLCNTCGRAFGYRNAMMKHQRRVHKREKLRFHYAALQQEKY